MSEYLGMDLLLGVTRLATEFMRKVNQPRLEGTHATGHEVFLCPQITLVPVTPSGVRTDVMSSSPLIL